MTVFAFGDSLREEIGHIIGGTAERHENMVIVGIHGGAAPRQGRQDCYRLVFKDELPALGVVTGRCQRRTADEFLPECGAYYVGQRAFSPSLRGDSLVALGVRLL